MTDASTDSSTQTSVDSPATSRRSTTKAYAAQAPDTPLAPFQIERRALRPHDVQVEILYSGVCHSDLHMVRNEWGQTIYPVVPGHERSEERRGGRGWW